MPEADYIVDEAGNKIITDEGDYIITEGTPPSGSSTRARTPLPPGFIQALKASAEWEILIGIDGVDAFASHDTVAGWFFPWFGEFKPILKSVSSIKHKIQVPFGKTNLAKVNFSLIDRSEWVEAIADYYIKNRRVSMMIVPRGGNYGDAYYTFFTGLVTEFEIANEILSIEAQDDLYVAKGKVPEENATNTQTLAFQNQSPIDIKKTLLETYGEIPAARLDTTQFDSERDVWFLGWYFDRVLTNPINIKKLINELDEQTLNVVFPDGDKITCATFAPPLPGQTLMHIEDDWLRGSVSVKGGMEDNFFNHCVVYYDWDESGSDEAENFDNVIIVSDAASQGASEWDEVARKEIKSKWIRSFTIAQPTNITGVVVYHCNSQNGAGNGTLAYDSTNDTLTWTAPGDAAGAAVDIDKDGKFQLFSSTTTKYIRVVVTYASLPVGDQNDTLAISTLPGSNLATVLATHWVARYRDPRAELTFDLDIADAVHLDSFIRVSDVIKISSERIVTKGKIKWDEERIFLTSVQPNFEKKRFRVSGLQTTFKKRYGFIGTTTLVGDYDAASETERDYAFIGDANNEVGTNNADGYYVW